MADKHYAVFIWYLLTTVLLVIVYTSADDPKKFVDLRNMQANNARSILMDGETVELEEWLPRVLNDRQAFNDDNQDKTSKIMYTFMKCECAHYVNASLRHVLRSLGGSLDGKRKEENEKKAIPLLSEFGKKLSLAIAVLFETGDIHESVKSTEPYLLITLLQTSLYVTSLIHMKPSDTTNLKCIKRVLLQFTNLVDQFAIEHCNADLDRDKKCRDLPKRFEKGLEDFHTFLTTVISPVPISIDRGRITLKSRVLNILNVKQLKRGGKKLGTFHTSIEIEINAKEVVNKHILSMLNKVLHTAQIREPNKSAQTLTDFGYTYDVYELYKYLFATYRILLKSMYLLTVRLWEQDQQLDVQWYERTIAKLRSMYCPVEVIEHFLFAMKIEGYRSDGSKTHKRARDAAMHFMEKSAHTRIDEVLLEEADLNKILEYADYLNLSNFMEAVFDDELQQFWWVFNLMHRESEQKSRNAYNFSVHMSPKISNIYGADPNTESKCNSLVEVYRNFLNTKVASSYISLPSNKISNKIIVSDTSSEIRFMTYKLLEDLLKQSAIWVESMENQLRNIFLATCIHLYREVYFELDYVDFKEYAIKKRNKLIMIINVFTNLLDNYQIRKCRVINDRRSVYRSIRKTAKMNAANFLNRCFGLASSTTNTLRNVPEQVPTEIYSRTYDFDKLTQYNSVIKLKTYGTDVFFNWDGEAVNMRDIQTDVFNNMLNIHDIVNYQCLYSKWLFWVLYKRWFARLTFEDLETLKPYEHSESIRKYVQYYESKFNFYKTVHNNYGGHDERSADMLDMVKKETMSSIIELLGIIREDDRHTYDIEDLLGLEHKETSNSILLGYINALFSTIKYDFTFLE